VADYAVPWTGRSWSGALSIRRKSWLCSHGSADAREGHAGPANGSDQRGSREGVTLMDGTGSGSQNPSSMRGVSCSRRRSDSDGVPDGKSDACPFILHFPMRFSFGFRIGHHSMRYVLVFDLLVSKRSPEFLLTAEAGRHHQATRRLVQ
jgi:hypothetical protein